MSIDLQDFTTHAAKTLSHSVVFAGRMEPVDGGTIDDCTIQICMGAAGSTAEVLQILAEMSAYLDLAAERALDIAVSFEYAKDKRIPKDKIRAKLVAAFGAAVSRASAENLVHDLPLKVTGDPHRRG